jgi:hypothetical protein
MTVCAEFGAYNVGKSRFIFVVVVEAIGDGVCRAGGVRCGRCVVGRRGRHLDLFARACERGRTKGYNLCCVGVC